ncbi:phage transcriptional repressor [Streptococcus pseudoporcinus]|uniref:Phage transcriptional repressor n=1 Tax=Streptococcus pseudoporcinus TaxID=361101 RepID=A0A4U9XMV3_9STRE|nr:helix-turn-helix transcriptional regulator [Streptococcus pseudoporcinus]VTS14733.1 phage transcriptional repressor [Streptococcus pseudoporcinus]
MALTVGERIKKRRKEIKMSVEELATKVDVSMATIYRYEKGDIEKVDTEVLGQIARALRVSPSVLMGWEEEEQSDEILDLTDIASKTAAYDGHTLDDSDIELIKSLLENMVKNK